MINTPFINICSSPRTASQGKTLKYLMMKLFAVKSIPDSVDKNTPKKEEKYSRQCRQKKKSTPKSR